MKRVFCISFLCHFLTLQAQQDAPYSSPVKLYPCQPFALTNWQFRQAGEAEWQEAKVPGTILDNLVNLSDLSNPLHPYYGDNETRYQWVSEKDWEFHTTVYIDQKTLDGKYYDLTFESLHTFADIQVNDQHITSCNAFIPVQVTHLTDSKLEITVYFHSTVSKANERMGKDTIKLPGGERVYVRSPQYEFGWDWGPRFINMGIRKPVTLTLHRREEPRIDHLEYKTIKDGKKDEKLVVYLVGENTQDTLACHLKVYLNGDSIGGNTGLKTGNFQDVLLCELKEPKDWWPNGNGEPNYYEFDIRFTFPGDTNTLAHRHFFYAHANIELLREKDGWGESFTFLVNGEKIYAKGANYIPDDSFHPGKNTPGLIRMAKEANMNMLRIWGGGTYPDDDFYIECMKNGIMIWQDFMFACAMYPSNSDTWDVQNEANYRYNRLHCYNHIALWCGNNENDEGWKNWGWQKEFGYSAQDSSLLWNHYTTLFDTLIPGVNGTNPIKNYVPSSPQFGWGRKQSMTHGDSHFWGVWWGLEPIEKYEEKVPRFMSEFGMQAMPDLSTLQKVLPDSSIDFTSPLFKNHQKHPTGFQTLDHYLRTYLSVPVTMEEYIYATQVLQAYSFTTAIEAQRRNRNYCMGSLIWQLNDCWPVTSWSIIDYELMPKMAYHAIQQAFKPLLVSVEKDGNTYNVYVVNDLPQALKGSLTLSISDFYGNKKYEKKVAVHCKAGCSKIYATIPENLLKELDAERVYLHVSFTPADQKTQYSDSKDYYFVPFHQLKLPAPELLIFTVDSLPYISSRTYCPFVRFTSNGNPVCLESMHPYQMYPLNSPVDSTGIQDSFKSLFTLVK